MPGGFRVTACLDFSVLNRLNLILPMGDKPSGSKKSGSLKYPRYVRALSFSFRDLSAAENAGSSGGTMEAKTYDISAGGLRFESDLSLSSGTELECTIRFSPSFEVTVSGKVLRVDVIEDETGESRNYVAVEFEGLDPEVKAQISENLAPIFRFQISEEAEEAEEAEGEGSGEPANVGFSKEGVTIMHVEARKSGSEEKEKES
jgi:hypothetical protein